MQHKTVLLHEAVDSLQLSEDDTVVDATFGSGGHAGEIVRRLSKGGVYIGIDVDETALTSVQLPETEATIHLVNDNFNNITEILGSLHIKSVDAILADLGWRSEQFTESGKGFSFMSDEPLQMTFGNPESYAFTAEDIVNEWEEKTLADIIFGYGEERSARRISKAIVDSRKLERIATAKQLADCVAAALPRSAQFKRIHPATRTFQALRIAVNDELQVLEKFLADAFLSLAPNGRLSIISFHSLEDRVVKHYFKEMVAAKMGTLATKKPIVPGEMELKNNPRSRSAKLRTIIKS
jgi:16S rRNA (cytosine1402-N4)-methyltransferase